MRTVAILLAPVLVACGGSVAAAELQEDGGPQDAAPEAAVDAGLVFCEPGRRELPGDVYERCFCQDVEPADAAWMLGLTCQSGERRVGGECQVAAGAVIVDEDLARGTYCAVRVETDAAVKFCVWVTCAP
jgi:hypothetical protein